MYKKIITTIFTLITLILYLPVHAEMIPSSDSSTYTSFIGKVDAIYTKEKQIIINDISISYDHKSKFFNEIRSPILNITEQIQQNYHVKYRIKPSGESTYLLLELQLISKGEFNALNVRTYDD